MADLGDWGYEGYTQYEYPEGYCPKCYPQRGKHAILASKDDMINFGQDIFRQKVNARVRMWSVFGEVEGYYIHDLILDKYMQYMHCDECGYKWCYLMYYTNERNEP